MKKKKSFVTIFPLTENVHLMKDVGMIPYIMYRDFGYDSTIVAFRNEEVYPALEKEVHGLKMDFLEEDPKYKMGKCSFSVLKYIFKHAKEIDILNLYHPTNESWCYGFFYKIFNPKGIVYLKLDFIADDFSKSINRYAYKKLRYKLLFRAIPTFISYEIDYSGVILKDDFPKIKKFIKITNGIDHHFIDKQGIKRNTFEEKENLILTVGRIGSRQKNSELLLKAIESIDLNDWSIVFIGPIEDTFQTVIDTFFQRNPHLQEKVIFTGPVYDRAELYNWYNRAKIFCLTSRWESFGIVLAEALYWGNYIITTNVSSAEEITANSTIGEVVKEDTFTTSLQQAIHADAKLRLAYVQTLKHSEKYLWTNILSSLNKALNSLFRAK